MRSQEGWYAPSSESPTRRYAPVVPVDPALAEQLVTEATNARQSTKKRDELIRRAHAEGGSLREIARLAGLHHSTVQAIIDKS